MKPRQALVVAALLGIYGRADAQVEAGFGTTTGGGAGAAVESFKTDLFTGTASVSIPLLVPPGTNDVQPSLTLRYRSGAGDGWLGRGWQLGFGSIRRDTRMGLPAYDDAPTSGDHFSWDDDLLVRDDGGSYHRERESFETIERVDGPTGDVEQWTVHTTDGTTFWFGSDPAARVVDPTSGKTFSWQLDREEDRNGNFVRYEYQSPTGSDGVAYPMRISYSFRGDDAPASPTLRTVDFVLEPRPDPTLAFVGGVKRAMAKRLSEVDVRKGGVLVTRYDLVYADEVGMGPPNGRSHLQKVIRFGADDTSTLPSDVFSYAGGAGPAWAVGPEAAALATRMSGLGGSGFNLTTTNWSLVDVNGDAASDVVFTSPSSSDARIWVNHKEHVTVDGFDVPWFHTASSKLTPAFNVPFTGNLTVHVARPWAHWADYTGDGRTDLLLGLHNLTTAQELVLAWRNSGWTWLAEDPNAGSYTQPPADLYAYRTDCGPFLVDFGRTKILDVDGDGLADLVEHRVAPALQTDCAAPSSNENWTERAVYRNQGDGWAAAPDSEWSPALGSALDTLGVLLSQLLVFDLNGDGLADLAPDVDGDGAIDGATVLVHTGRGWTSAASLGLSVPSGLRPVDLDGDGLPDHAGSPPLFNRGSDFVSSAALPALPAPFDAPGSTEAFVDLDGDGRVDLLSAPQGAPVVLMLSTEAAGDPGPQGSLAEVERAEGGRVRFTYEATTQASCYSGSLGGCHADPVYWALSTLQAQGLSCSPPLRTVASLCELPIQTLPLRIHTLRGRETDDANGNVSLDLAAYDRGFFSGADREFRGFGLVSELPQTLTYPNPKTGGSELVSVLRQTRFYQRAFLRGAPAVSDVYGFSGGLTQLLEHTIHQFAVTRADLSGTALLQGEDYLVACDLQDPNQVAAPAQSGCDGLVDLETSVYGALPLPQPLPYAPFRARFGPGNRDRADAYLVLPIATQRVLYDGDPNDPIVGLSERWHDPFGNVQLEWDHGTIGDPNDDRLSLREYASPVGPLAHLRALPSRSIRQTVPGAVLLSEDLFQYDGLQQGLVANGNLTRQLSGLGADQVAIDRAFSAGTFGLPSHATDPYAAGETPSPLLLEYDTSQTFVERTTRGGLSTETLYDPPGAPPGLGVVRESRDSSGAQVSFGADSFGRTLSRSGPSPIGTVEQRSYDDFAGFDPNRPRVAVTLHDGNGTPVTTRTFTDGLGRAIRIERDGLDDVDQPATVVQRTAYDLQGRRFFQGRAFLAGAVDPGGTTTRFDERGRRRFVETPGGGVREFQHTRTTEVEISPEAARLERVRDPRGSVVQVRERLFGTIYVTRYLYDPAGRLRAVCDAMAATCPVIVCASGSCDVSGGDPRHVAVIDYDSLGRKTRLIDPDQGTVIYAYDARGRLVRQTDARGAQLGFVYDAVHGRLVCENPSGALDCSGADTVYTYGDELGAGAPPNSLGRLVSAASPGGTQTYGYDTRGRIAAVGFEPPDSSAAWTFATTYDWLDRETATTYPDGEVVVRAYDRMGLDRVSSSARTYVADLRHDADGRPTMLDRGNGTRRVLDYAAGSGWLERIHETVVTSGADIVDRTFVYDDDGRIVHLFNAIDPAFGITNVMYDELGRITAAQGGPLAYTNTYDSIGNLIQRDGTPLPYEHPTKPHALYAAADPNRFGYDASGNMIRREGVAHAYDVRGRLASIASPLEVAFLYDHTGERSRASRGASVSDFLGPDVELLGVAAPGGSLAAGLRLVKTVRAEGAVVARVSTAGPIAVSAAPPRRARGGVPQRALTSLALFGSGSLILLIVLTRRRRRGLALVPAARAGGVVLVFTMGQVTHAPAWVPDGDLNADGSLDAADALLCRRIDEGAITPTAEQWARGDVAPLESAPESPPNIDVADLMLLLRAISGADVDGDGVGASTELSHGLSPFRADSDGDGIGDADVVAALQDADADGASDTAEALAGSDPLDPDTDGDGLVDGDDPDPLSAAGTVVEWLHTGHLGSVLAVTDDVAAVVREVHHGLWGDVVSATDNAPRRAEGFTGQRFDSYTGLSYYGARFYDAALGRFLSPDSYVANPLDPQNLNRYAYVRNDPLNRVDPTGNFFGFFRSARRSLGRGLSSFARSFAGAINRTYHYVELATRVAWTAATSAAAVAVSPLGIPADLYTLSRKALGIQANGPSAARRAEIQIGERGNVADVVLGVGSGHGQGTNGVFLDLLEFAFIDNIGSNFPSLGKLLASGWDRDATQVYDRLRRKLGRAEAENGSVEVQCSSQGCAKVRFALLRLADLDGADLDRIHVSAYGAATRFDMVLRTRLGSLDSYANPGDIFVALPYGERIGLARWPPINRVGQFSPYPPSSHEFKAYCADLDAC